MKIASQDSSGEAKIFSARKQKTSFAKLVLICWWFGGRIQIQNGINQLQNSQPHKSTGSFIVVLPFPKSLLKEC